MDKSKIVMTRSLLPVDQKYITDGLFEIAGDSFDLVAPESFDEDGICKVIADADALLGSFITPKILKEGRNIKLIQVPWTGMDTFNFAAMEGFDIPVCNTHSNAESVAELAVSLVLDLLKKVSYHDRKMRIGDWNRGQQPLNLKSQMVSKQIICMIGCGNIGYRIAKLLKAFGADVIAVDGNITKDSVLSTVYLNKDISIALNSADVAICTLPLTESTKGLINKDLLELSKDGMILVNMSRANIIDEDAVFNALKSGKLSGFASDVWWNAPNRGESESYPSTHNEFWKLDNVIMSPHRAGFVEGCLPHLDEAITNLANLIQGKPLINIVNIQNHY